MTSVVKPHADEPVRSTAKRTRQCSSSTSSSSSSSQAAPPQRRRTSPSSSSSSSSSRGRRRKKVSMEARKDVSSKKKPTTRIPDGVFESASPKERPRAKKAKDGRDSNKASSSSTPSGNLISGGSNGARASRCGAGAPAIASDAGGQSTKAPGGLPEAPAAPHAATAAAAKLRVGLGDLAALQKTIEEDRGRLQLFVIRAKAELEEQRETNDRKMRREREYYKAQDDEPLGPENRFLVQGELGKGAFSTVYKCRDLKARGNSAQEFAVKFVRKNDMLRKATEREVRMYRRLRNEASVEDPDGYRHLMNLGSCETFEHEGHLAVVFPLMRCDMRAGLRKYGQGGGLPITNVAAYAKQIFLALRALQKVKVIHSDLKPENLLMTADKSTLKLADFGSAMDLSSDRIRSDDLQPRYYRAPEVMLGQPYTMSIDMWSAGCTVFELASGGFLFTGADNNGMLHTVLKAHGEFSRRFATSGEFASKHFNANGDFLSKGVIPMASFKKPARPLLELVERLIRGQSQARESRGTEETLLRLLADLLARCTAPDPNHRATPEQALTHSLFRK